MHNRILIWEAAQPADFREVGILAGLKCPDLQISEEVLRHVLVESHAVARRIVTLLGADPAPVTEPIPVVSGAR